MRALELDCRSEGRCLVAESIAAGCDVQLQVPVADDACRVCCQVKRHMKRQEPRSLNFVTASLLLSAARQARSSTPCITAWRQQLRPDKAFTSPRAGAWLHWLIKKLRFQPAKNCNCQRIAHALNGRRFRAIFDTWPTVGHLVFEYRRSGAKRRPLWLIRVGAACLVLAAYLLALPGMLLEKQP